MTSSRVPRRHAISRGLLAVALVVGAGAFVAAPTTAAPTAASSAFPGQNGKIVYEVDDGTDDEIDTINPDGSGRLQLTDNTTDDDDPAWSPNGKRIAYASDADGDYEIYTIKAGGGGKKQVTDNGLDDYYPAWSPDGQRIVYRGYDGTDSEIFTIGKDGGGGAAAHRQHHQRRRAVVVPERATDRLPRRRRDLHGQGRRRRKEAGHRQRHQRRQPRLGRGFPVNRAPWLGLPAVAAVALTAGAPGRGADDRCSYHGVVGAIPRSETAGSSTRRSTARTTSSTRSSRTEPERSS